MHENTLLSLDKLHPKKVCKISKVRHLKLRLHHFFEHINLLIAAPCDQKILHIQANYQQLINCLPSCIDSIFNSTFSESFLNQEGIYSFVPSPTGLLKPIQGFMQF